MLDQLSFVTAEEAGREADHLPELVVGAEHDSAVFARDPQDRSRHQIDVVEAPDLALNLGAYLVIGSVAEGFDRDLQPFPLLAPRPGDHGSLPFPPLAAP